jgi:hypothetical protein
MLTTNDSQVWDRAWSYKDHGKSYDAVYHRQHPIGFRWLHESFGTNWRMTEVQSAIGRVALRKVPGWIEIRRRHARALTEWFSQIPALRLALPPGHMEHAYYRYYAFVYPELLQADWNRDRILAVLNAEGIPCFTGSCSEIYLERAFPPEWRPAHRLPIARELGETSLTFLVHPTLTADHIRASCEAVEKVMSVASRTKPYISVAVGAGR